MKREMVMFNENVWRRLLYISATLITFVVFSIVMVVIPYVIGDTTPQSTPERAVPAFWVIAGIRLLIVACLVWALVANKNGRNINKEILVFAGVASILLGLVTLDAAGAYLGHQGAMPKIAFLLFVCVGFDIVAGILVITARFFQKKLAK